MKNSSTIETKHVFIDVVNYTFNRSVEAQTEIIAILNKIVLETIRYFKLTKKNVLFIPTGDGMCISLLNVFKPFDIHLLIALMLLEKLEKYNKSQKDEMRKFQIRIGINENIDNLIIDINKNRNISGSGINIASRIEGEADANQILVSSSVYDRLVSREKYMKSFASYSKKVKHSLQLNIYHYRNEKLKFLNSAIPTNFQIKKNEIPRLTEFEASYLACCFKNKDFILSNAGNSLLTSALHAYIYLKTLDFIDNSRTTQLNRNSIIRVNDDENESLKKILNSNIWLNHEIHNTLLAFRLNLIYNCFSEKFLIVNELGLKRLEQEYPEIFKKVTR